MLRTRALPGAVAVLLATAGCDSAIDPADITVTDLVGTWTATRFQFTELGGGTTLDLIQNGGSATLTLAATGALTGAIAFAGQSDTIDGTVSVAGGKLTLTEGGEVTVFDIALDGNTLTLTTDDAAFDFPLDDVDGPVPASLVIVATRQ